MWSDVAVCDFLRSPREGGNFRFRKNGGQRDRRETGVLQLRPKVTEPTGSALLWTFILFPERVLDLCSVYVGRLWLFWTLEKLSRVFKKVRGAKHPCKHPSSMLAEEETASLPSEWPRPSQRVTTLSGILFHRSFCMWIKTPKPSPELRIYIRYRCTLNSKYSAFLLRENMLHSSWVR